MRRIWSMAVLPVALLASIAGGCETEPSNSPVMVGQSRFDMRMHSMEQFQLLYEATPTNPYIHFLFSNLELLGSPSVVYHLWMLGELGSLPYAINMKLGLNAGLNGWTKIYDEYLHPIYTIHFGYAPTVDITTERFPYFFNFEGPIEYTLIEDEADEDSNTISYLSNTPDIYVLEFIGAKGIDINDYTDQIEEQVDILSRNYVIMDSGVTRYVTISDSSEEVEA